MKNCYFCEVQGDKANLFEVIYKNVGVISVCRKCSFKEKMPVIGKKEVNVEEVTKRESVRERLTRMANLKPKKEKEEHKDLVVDDGELRRLVEDNFKKKLSGEEEARDQLMEHFEWLIMRKRRSLKMTREKLAKAVLEQPIVIETLEKGNLPRDYIMLIKKIENVLGIRLLKERSRDFRYEDIIGESKVPSGILISELKEKTKETTYGEEDIMPEDINLKKIKEISGKPVGNGNGAEKKNLDELTEDEISGLIWGKK